MKILAYVAFCIIWILVSYILDHYKTRTNWCMFAGAILATLITYID